MQYHHLLQHGVRQRLCRPDGDLASREIALVIDVTHQENGRFSASRSGPNEGIALLGA